MKIQNIRYRLGLILFAVTISACGQSIGNLVTPSPVVSIQPTKRMTSLPSVISSPTVSATATSTPAVISVLSIEEAQARFLGLLSNNADCQLPCLWGIVPGKSSFQEAQAILAPLGSISDFTAFRSGLGSVSPYFVEGDLEIYTTVDLIANSDNDIVNSIAFNAEARRPIGQGGYEDIFNSAFFAEKVGAYALQYVLSEQGIPTSVMIATFGGPLTRGGTGGFDILLLYPEQGILVNYTAQMQFVGTDVRGCPANAHVQMELYSPGQTDSFLENLKETDWKVKLNYYKPLEEVTSMSLEQFYKVFSQSSDQCIETPVNLWPVPEP